MKTKNFAAFILTHGRPNKVYTYKTLKKAGYTGKIYLIIDNEDQASNEYYKLYGEEVIMFDKAKIAKMVDQGDNFNDYRTTTHVRNAIFEEAKKLGLDYFIQLDDDYYEFIYKFNSKLEYCSYSWIKNLNTVFDSMVDFYKVTNCQSVTMAQCGDFIGGGAGSFGEKLKLRRKAMNSFICSTERPFRFISRLNEDVNTYLTLGRRGELFFTVPNMALNQKDTQGNSGGMTETYLDNGTYIKSFYTVMYAPDCAKVRMMGVTKRRLHHSITWKNAVPVILSENYKKYRDKLEEQ